MTLVALGNPLLDIFSSFDPEAVYIIAGDETIKPKTGENTYGLDRFFSSTTARSQVCHS